jgi:hypothetical protein
MIRARSLIPLLLPMPLASGGARLRIRRLRDLRLRGGEGRRFIELCASSPVTEDGYLQYRFGSLDAEGEEQSAELEYPAELEGSLARFYGATYTQKGIYTQSVRFVSGAYSYAVFTRAKGEETIDAGVEVRNRDTGKTSTVACSERPRFYIGDSRACSPATGNAGRRESASSDGYTQGASP